MHRPIRVSSSDLPKWAALLADAVRTPGMIMEAYTAFHSYSTGNQILALWQCRQRGLAPGPLNTFSGWQGMGRQIKKGERALCLCMPVTVKDKRADKRETGDEGRSFTTFVYKPRWFVLSQTEGQEIAQIGIPAFDLDHALTELGIERLPFEKLDGNCQGYARGKGIALNPLAQLPHKTLFHEAAHVVLGHTTEGDCVDNDITPKSLREVEAESVAFICCESLGLQGAEFCRGYIQTWLNGETEIPEKSAQKIFHAADLILKAGREGK